jgi:hypothetical protein
MIAVQSIVYLQIYRPMSHAPITTLSVHQLSQRSTCSTTLLYLNDANLSSGTQRLEFLGMVVCIQHPLKLNGRTFAALEALVHESVGH